MDKRRGFTLVEVLALIAIVALLQAIWAPTLKEVNIINVIISSVLSGAVISPLVLSKYVNVEWSTVAVFGCGTYLLLHWFGIVTSVMWVLIIPALGMWIALGIGYVHTVLDSRKEGKKKGLKGLERIVETGIPSEEQKSAKLRVNCPQCGRQLRGATRDMIGDIGVCPKCKAEFVIEQKQ